MKLMTGLFGAAFLTACGADPDPTPVGDGASAVPRFEEIGPEAAFPVSVPAAFQSRRGYLVVAEDREKPEGRQLRLPVAIVKAKASSGAAPVLFLPGGPGVGGMSAAAYAGAYPWTETRDFIILGRRGTDFAEPALMCPEFGEAFAAAPAGDDPAVIAAAAACRAEYEASGVDLSQYHSAASAQDIDDLRQVLGEDQLALFALSYGTRLALTIERDFPGTVETIALDSPLPHGAHYDDESIANYADVLRRIGAACEAAEDCAAAFPNVAERFFATVNAAVETPPDYLSQSGKTAADLATVVSIGSRFEVSIAPYLMNVVARLDEEVLDEAFAREGGPASFAWGVRLSNWCSEALPFSERAKTADAPPGFAGLDGAVFHPAVCAAWGTARRPAAEVAPTVSSVPTLIIAGGFDPLTPAKWGEAAAATLENSRVVVIPGGVHTETTDWGGDGCAMSIAAGFFDDPAAVLEADGFECIENAPATEFYTDR